MERTALDTSVVVAALLTWHEHHARAFEALMAARSSKSGPILPLPALLESYAVMTRLPAPSRLSPNDALRPLGSAFGAAADVAAIDGKAAWELIEGLASAGTAGGATYDAHILACAKAAGAERLATLNRRHFERLDLGRIQLVVP